MMSSAPLPNNHFAVSTDSSSNSNKRKRRALSDLRNGESVPDAVASAAIRANGGLLRSPIAIPLVEGTLADSQHPKTKETQREDEGALSIVQNLQNQLNTLRDDMRHLEKRCKFLENKCKIYQKRQRKIERALLKEGDKSGGDDDENDGEENSADEEALDDFYAGEDGDRFAGSNDDTDDGEDDGNKNKKGKDKNKPHPVSDALVFPARTLDFLPMFERLRIHHQLHGTCSVSNDYGDKQLKIWTYKWRDRRRRFEKMVQREGGPEVVFAGLDDVDAKTYSKDAIPQYNYEWEEKLVKSLKSKQSRHRRRFLLRTRHQIMCLNTLDFNWNIIEVPSFEDRLEQLKQFIEEHGHYNVHRSYVDLGNWFHKMKGNFVFGKKHFMEKQYPKLLEMGVDMNVAVQGRKRRRRKRRNNDGDFNNDDQMEQEGIVNDS